jgi:hypothetical protein
MSFARTRNLHAVIPAKAGISNFEDWDSRLRGNDKSDTLLRLIDLIEHTTIREKLFLGLLPAAKNRIINFYQTLFL